MLTPTPSHGWLWRRDDLPWEVHGVQIDPATRTRREEYRWVAEQLRDEPYNAKILDVATGYVPTWHMMPEILDAMGFTVDTIDADPRTMDMPPSPNIYRRVGDMTALPFDDGAYDIVLCISTLEHLSHADARKALSELARVARQRVIMTADEAPWLAYAAAEHGLAAGPQWHVQGMIHLTPAVYAADCLKVY